MRARCVSYTGDHATVVIEPSWFEWLLGCRRASLDLEYIVRPTGGQDWRTVATRRWIDGGIPNGERDAILNALDFREVGSEPRRVRALIGGAVAP